MCRASWAWLWGACALTSVWIAASVGLVGPVEIRRRRLFSV